MSIDTKDSKDLFYIGLDIGTNSVGWAATNGDYQLFKIRGKSTIGVRLFDEAKVASERRVSRATKVRGQRAKKRITLLQQLFAPYIAPIDPLFFSRLAASSYWADDKDKVKGMPEGLSFDQNLNSVFADNEFSDKDYFKKFPTIYHLREHLADRSNWQGQQIDVRLVYLAIHHILKNRGHFIYEGQTFTLDDEGKKIFESINEYLDKEVRQTHPDNEGEQMDMFLIDQPVFDGLPEKAKFKIPDDFKIVDDIMRKRCGATRRTEKLLCAFGLAQEESDGEGKKDYTLKKFDGSFDKTLSTAQKNHAKEHYKRLEGILKLVTGRKFNIGEILPQYKDSDDLKESLEFNSKWDEEIAPKLESILGDDFEFVELCKSAYDWGILSKLLDGHSSISKAMLSKYESHAEQLRCLKDTVRTAISKGWLSKDKYDEIFRGLDKSANKIGEIEAHYSNFGGDKLGTYASYIGSNLVHNTKYINVKDGKKHSKVVVPKANREIFYDYLKGVVLNMAGLSKWDELEKSLDFDDPRNDTTVQYTVKTSGQTHTKSSNFVTILQDIKADIDNNSYLLKLRSSDNGSIPYQLHQAELALILQNATEFGLLGTDLDEDGLTVSKKIESILTFRVPYYVGRLNPFYNSQNYKDKRDERGLAKVDKAHHVWISRSQEYERLKQEGKDPKILPWNYSKMIDLDESGTNFIQRMLAKCKYMHDETVLPKNSLIYSKFMVLNQLNTIKINETKLPLDVKHSIFKDLFLKDKKVSTKRLVGYLKDKGIVPDNFESEQYLSGIDKKEGFTQGLSSWRQARAIFDNDGHDNYEFDNNVRLQEIVEQVLVWQAIHTDKKLVEKSIIKNYIFELVDYCKEPELNMPMSQIVDNYNFDKHPKTKKIIQGLKGLNYKGFGNMSRQFLTGQWVENSIGEKTCILDLLWDGTWNPNSTWGGDFSPNLMQILGNPMSVDNKVYAYLNQVNFGDDVSSWAQDDPRWYNVIAESYAAPSVKRSTWQSIKIINELIQEVGKQPDKIFVEVTRSGSDMKGEAGKKESRKKLLEDWYNTSKKDIEKRVFDELEGDNITDSALRSEKLFLYFMQAGKCMYSGEPINLEDILNGSTEYDVDHIVPQRLVKDDSIRNKVLVRRDLNNTKSGTYPLCKIGKIWNNPKVKQLWQALNNVRNKGQQKLLSDAKFARLSRTAEFSDSELEGFVARQLVFAGQSTTVVAELLKQKYKNNLGDKDASVLQGSTLIDSGRDWSNSTEIVYSKAGNVSDFRKEYDFLKSREVNDFHHAHDAYLNIVVANTLQHWFGFFRDRHKQGEDTSSKWIFRYPVYKLGSNKEQLVWIPPQYETFVERYVDGSGNLIKEVEKIARFQKLDERSGAPLEYVVKKDSEPLEHDLIDEDGLLIPKGTIRFKKGDKLPWLSDKYKCRQYRGYLSDGKTPIYTGTLATVQKVLDYKFVLVSKMTRENKGQFYKQTLFSPGVHQRDGVVSASDFGDECDSSALDDVDDSIRLDVSDRAIKSNIVKDAKIENDTDDDNNLIPRKGSSALLPSNSPLGNTARYGGFKSKNAAFMCIIQYKHKDVYGKNKLKSKGEIVRRWFPIYIMDKPAWDKWDEAQKVEYIQKLLLDDRDKKGNLTQEAKKIQPGTVQIVVPKVDINTKIKIGGVEAFAVGYNTANGIISCNNAKQWHIDYDNLKYVRIVGKWLETANKNKEEKERCKGKDKILVSGKPNSDQVQYELTKQNNEKLYSCIVGALKTMYGQDWKDNLAKRTKNLAGESLNLSQDTLFGQEWQSVGKQETKTYSLKNKNLGMPDVSTFVERNEQKFKNLDITDQLDVLQSLIQGLGVNAKNFNIDKKYFKEALTGAIKPGVMINNPTKKTSYPLKIVCQSTTGLKQSETVVYPF